MEILRFAIGAPPAPNGGGGVHFSEEKGHQTAQLSEKANGLFIYAATACRFLDAGDFADPMDRQDRLDLILDTGPATDGWGEDGPQNHIDDIYLKVLSFPAREKLSPAARRITYEIMKNALGFLVTVFQPVTIQSLGGFVQCGVKGPGDMTERL